MKAKKNKFIIPLIVFAVLILASGVKAIVFIPPIIYIATLSIGSFILNLCAFLAVWLAARGVLDRGYFGKAMHEIVGLILGLLGKSALLVLSAMVPILVLNPLNRQDIAFSSLVAGALSFALLSLNVFRRYRLAQKNEKISLIGSTVFFSVLVILVTFASASLALETKTLRNRDNETGVSNDSGKKGFKMASPPSGIADSSPSLGKKKAADFRESTPDGYYQSNNEGLESSQSIRQEIWFYPASFDACEIYFNDRRILAVYPSRNCYFYDANGQPAKIPCPIQVSASQVPLNASGNLYGNGSCTENYSIFVSKDGFNVNR